MRISFGALPGLKPFNATVFFNPESNKYIVQEKIGGLDFGNPKIMSFSEYQDYAQQKSVKDYWNLRSKERGGNQTSALGLPKLFIPGKAFDNTPIGEKLTRTYSTSL